MRHPVLAPRLERLVLLGVAAVAVVAARVYFGLASKTARTASETATSRASTGPTADPDTMQLSDSQLGSIKTAAVTERDFPTQKEAIGNIAFNDDMNVEIFTPYQGRIIQTFADLGDDVKKGQILFTIESADFIAAQSNLIGAAATLDRTASALNRARRLYAAHGIDQNDYEAAVAPFVRQNIAWMDPRRVAVLGNLGGHAKCTRTGRGPPRTDCGDGKKARRSRG
jgi:multidrug efflux pump subunit AcrA (membrane-fusion protein)